jgi:hypothetical protein
MTRDGSPFDCACCTDKNQRERNCFNLIGLNEDARAVENYSDDVKDELRSKSAKKVIGLTGLRLYECPLSYISVETVEIVRLVYLVDSSGSFLHEGGIGAQPAWLIEAYELYKVERARSMKDKGI